MQPTIALLTALLFAGRFPEPVELAFRPAPGTVLEKVFEVETALRIDSVHLNERDVSAALNGLDAWDGCLEVRARLETVDDYVRVGGGRPLELVRDYDVLETRWGWVQRHDVLHTALHRSVRFTWDEDDGAYDLAWGRSRTSAPVPAGLWEDLDCRGLLPAGPVERGESWSVPLERLAPTLLPGGAIHRDEGFWETWELFELEQALAARAEAWLETGALTCTLDAVVDAEGGGRLAEVHLAWRWSTWFDPLETGSIAPWWERLGSTGIELRLEVRGEGHLTWDLAAGHFRELELEVEVDYELGVDTAWGELELGGEGWGRWCASAAAER